MEVETSVNDMLREVITFLECLRDVQLPFALETLRERLLARSKDTLTIVASTIRSRLSPEPYLNMNSGPKSLSLTKCETDNEEEYVGMEESPKRVTQSDHQGDYYETFEHKEGQCSTAINLAATFEPTDDEREESAKMLIDIYKNLSAMESKSKCHKCGPLYRKVGKKLFLSSESRRACWIALVGSHLLIYRNERHNRPCAIYPVYGYMARPAPNLLSRDRQKSESAFEMYCPGNETLQFIARTPKDMNQWIAKISQMGRKEDAEIKFPINSRPDDPRVMREKSIESKARIKTTSKKNKNGDDAGQKDEFVDASPPPLPARIPRRLPSLPSDNSISSYKAAAEDYDDEDEIYHKIQDLKNGLSYQNVLMSRKKQQFEAPCSKDEDDMYDDVRAFREKEEMQMRENKSDDAMPLSIEETYDDIVALSSRIDRRAVTRVEEDPCYPLIADDEQGEETYDDVTNLTPDGGFEDRAKNQTETLNKFPQKKSFLDRVWSRKESSGGWEKKFRGKLSSSSSLPIVVSSITKEIPTHNDIESDQTLNKKLLVNEDEKSASEYNCPPPPRPIGTKSPIVANNSEQMEEIYDDVSTCREERNRNCQRTMSEQAEENKTKFRVNGHFSLLEEEIEHYQSPRSNMCVRESVSKIQQNEKEEELYDDIALWADFTARQRDINKGEKKDETEAAKSTIGSEKKYRNRFAVNRKFRSSNHSTWLTSENENTNDYAESNGSTKRNTLQKLISKMENSLAKVSAKSPPSLSTSKLNNAGSAVSTNNS